MALLVKKFGGTSVGSIERIKAVADHVARARSAGDDLVIVVSAMAGETNRLFALASELCETPDARETDVLVATGEQVSAALLAMRLQCARAARQFPSWPIKCRVQTDSVTARARIRVGRMRARARCPARPSDRRGRGLSGRRSERQYHDAGTRRFRSDGGRDGGGAQSRRSAKSLPMSTASIPPTRISVPTRASSNGSPTTRCWRWRDSARRCCSCARSSWRAASMCR